MFQKDSNSLTLGTDSYNEITERWIVADVQIPKKQHRHKKREHMLLRIIKLIIKA